MSLPLSDARFLPHDSFSDRKPSSSSSWPASLAPQLLGALHPRKPKHRTTLIGLTFCVFLTTYVLLIHGSSLAPTLSLRHTDSPAADQLAIALESMKDSREDGMDFIPLNAHRYSDSPGRGGGRHRQQYPPLKLTPDQELAAICSFIASLPQNVIPPTVDPSEPIDPQLILDFDTRSPRAAEEVAVMVEDVWTRNPVFVYSKLYSPASRELKAILEDLRLHPEPTIVDIDMRDDVDVLKPALDRLTAAPEIPLLLIGGKVVGTMDEIREMSQDGRLQNLLAEAGAVVNGRKKKKGRKH